MLPNDEGGPRWGGGGILHHFESEAFRREFKWYVMNSVFSWKGTIQSVFMCLPPPGVARQGANNLAGNLFPDRSAPYSAYSWMKSNKNYKIRRGGEECSVWFWREMSKQEQNRVRGAPEAGAKSSITPPSHVSISVSMPACHAGELGSIPRRGSPTPKIGCLLEVCT